MANQSRADWRQFSKSQRGGSQRTAETSTYRDSPKGPPHTQAEQRDRQPPTKKTRMGTALQQRARELRLYPEKEPSHGSEDSIEDATVDVCKPRKGAGDAEQAKPGPHNSRRGAGTRQSREILEQKKTSPLLSVQLLPPATYRDSRDGIANCLSMLPSARKAYEYGAGEALSPVSMRPPGDIPCPVAGMPQSEKPPITSSQADSGQGSGLLYDPITSSEPQYGTEPSLGPMGGFYDNTIKTYRPPDREPAESRQQRHHPRMNQGRRGYQYGYQYKQSAFTPPKRRDLTTPAHDTSSPSPALTPLTRLKLSSYLAEAVCSNGALCGLFPNELYEWQADCLGSDEGICGGLRKNLVVSAPTSSGKTLLAEILLLRALGDDQQLLKQSRKALFVLPYVALCEEKARRLSKLIMPLSRNVKKAYGGEHSRQMWDPETGIIVCTPENANSMLNRMMEEGTPIEDEICCVVVDELHLVGREDRGTVMEMLLSKVAFISKLIRNSNGPSEQAHRSQPLTIGTPVTQSTPSDHFLQVIGLTATLPNIEEIARWLNAVPFSSDFRPVPLREYLKEADGTVKLRQRTGRMVGANGDPEYDLCTVSPTILPTDPDDPDHVGYLTHEAVAMGKSVMIFCATKKGCQLTAKSVVAYFRRKAAGASAGTPGIPPPSKEALNARKACAQEIDRRGLEYSRALAEVIFQGACFHHGNLTPVDRNLVEAAFRQGHVRVLCATSTLGTGVNLPIFRVIFKDAFQGMFTSTGYISQETYRQISGRAGRTGVDDWGESYLIVRKSGNQRVPRSHLRELLVGSLGRVESSVVVGGVLSRERCDRLVLEMLSAAQTQSQDMGMETLNLIMESTLVWAAATVDKRDEIAELVQSSLAWLATNFSDSQREKRRFGIRDINNDSMIERSKDGELEKINVTRLGKAVVASNMAPEEALEYMKDLNVALNQGFVTGNHLHVLYMCVPLTCTQITMNRSKYGKLLKLVSQADPLERRVHEILGLSQGFLTLASQNDTVRLMTAQDRSQVRICLRLYIAYMLYDIYLGSPADKITRDFEITSGKLLESLKEDVARFGKKAASLCRYMGKDVIAGSLREFASEVRNTNDESFLRLLECGVEKLDAAHLANLEVTSPELIVEKGKDELVRLLNSAYAVEGRDVDTHRLQAKVAKLIASAQSFIAVSSKDSDGGAKKTPVVEEGATASPTWPPGSTLATGVRANAAASRGAEPRRNAQAPDEKADIAHGDAGRASLADIGGDLDPAGGDGAGNAGIAPDPSTWQSIFDTIASGELLAIYMHASNLVDKKGRRTPETEMPKGRRPKPAEILPLGISFSWNGANEYVALKGQSRADAFISQFKAALSRRATTAYIAMIGWHNQIGVLEELVGLELAQIIDIKLGMWILEPDRYEMLVTNKFKMPSSSFGGKKRARAERKTNRINVRNTIQSASFETEAHEYCREILKLLDSAGTLEHYPQLRVDIGEGTEEPSSIHLKIAMRALRCLSSMMPVLRSSGLLRPLIETEMPICRIIGTIEQRGVGFRQTWLYDENRRLLEIQSQISKRASVVLQADTGVSKAVDLASTNELGTILYSRPYYAFPHPEINRIRNKLTSTSKDALLELRNEHPDNEFLKLILLYRSVADLTSTMVTLGRFKDGDGKLRTHFLQTSAGTGRIATDEPNLQCLQKRKQLDFGGREIDISLRNSIVAPTPGRLVLSADFKHIEFRVMAHLSDDVSMQNIMRRVNCDPFKLLACEWRPDEFPTEESVPPRAREHSKMLCYALLYGMGENRLAAELKIKPSEAAATRRDFLNRFPAMSQWIEREVRVCTEKKFIVTLNDRIRWMDNIRNEIDSGAMAADQRAAVNSICQGSAADVMKFAMIGIERRLKREFGNNPPCATLLQIHDELLFEVDKDRLPEATRVIKEEMEGAWIGLAVPLKVAFKVGESWGECKEYDA